MAELIAKLEFVFATIVHTLHLLMRCLLQWPFKASI